MSLIRACTGYPVLIEVTKTYLVWVEADTPEGARQRAADRAASLLPDGATVDGSIEARVVTEPVADWLDTDPDQVERLDAYFASQTV